VIIYSHFTRKNIYDVRKLYRISTMLISRAAIQLLQERCIIYNWKSYLSEIRRKECFLKRRHNCHHLEVKNYVSHLMSTHCVTRFSDAFYCEIRF